MKNRGRKKRSIINIVLSLSSQFITVVVGMLLPRALMVNYGSETNGLITSLQQMISYLTLIEGGLLSAVAVSLYKPLADNDNCQVNQILSSAKELYRKMGLVFLVMLIAFALIYPITIAETPYTYAQIIFMVLMIGTNGATQILFIGKYKALLMASQRNGLILMLNAGSTVLYSAVLIVASYLKLDLLLSLGMAVIAYMLRALAFYFVVKQIFPQYSFSYTGERISFPQRFDAFASQILSMLSLNGCVVVLSFLGAPMGQLSIYTTYNLVLSGIFMLMYSIENSVTSALGDLVAKEALVRVRRSYRKFDMAYQLVWAVVVSCLATLLVPFIRVYTKGITDINYVVPVEAWLFIAIAALWLLRNQLTLLMSAQGRFKDIRRAMTIEAAIVLCGGIGLYFVWEMKGVLVAKAISALYMVIVLMRYTHKVLLQESISEKLRRVGVSLVGIILAYIVGQFLGENICVDSFVDWIVLAMVQGTVSVVCVVIVYGSFYYRDMSRVICLANACIRKRMRKG